MVVNVMTSIGREIGKYLYPKTPTQCLPAKESIRVHVRMCMVVICLRTTPLIYRTYTCNIQINWCTDTCTIPNVDDTEFDERVRKRVKPLAPTIYNASYLCDQLNM